MSEGSEKNEAPPPSNSRCAKIRQFISENRTRVSWYTFAVIASICIIVGVVIGWELRVRSLETVDADPGNGRRSVSLQMELLSVDPVASSMVLNWFVLDDTCYSSMPDVENPTSADIPDECTTVSIYYDQNLIKQGGDNAEKNRTNTQPSDPVFIWDPKVSFDILSSIPAFRTTASMFTKGGSKGASLQDYPFDQYTAALFMYANDTNNSPVNLVRSSTAGIAVGFTTDTELGSADGIINDVLIFSRNSLVKAYVFVIVIGVWLITLIFVGSVMKEAFGYKQPKEAYVIPIATLFAITSLRSSMPGAPSGFGAIIDFVGILPCLAIITLTGVFLFAVLVLKKDDDEPEKPSQKKVV